ncbi:MAG TPA: plastocyanin/azurin family copper-binding protein [Burkholderiales bacterium]|jgi:plastocyanin|nr:plastocyanin/azurin family copper-binding protein [Burkholderiales bacterium]
MHKILLLALGLLLPFSTSSALAAEHVVGQKDKAFTVSKLKIKVGDVVVFKNDDPFFHNIFSLSEGQFFDLGSSREGSEKKVTFKKVGIVEVECAIHPAMKMVIEVTK